MKRFKYLAVVLLGCVWNCSGVAVDGAAPLVDPMTPLDPVYEPGIDGSSDAGADSPTISQGEGMSRLTYQATKSIAKSVQSFEVIKPDGSHTSYTTDQTAVVANGDQVVVDVPDAIIRVNRIIRGDADTTTQKLAFSAGQNTFLVNEASGTNEYLVFCDDTLPLCVTTSARFYIHLNVE